VAQPVGKCHDSKWRWERWIDTKNKLRWKRQWNGSSVSYECKKRKSLKKVSKEKVLKATRKKQKKIWEEMETK